MPLPARTAGGRREPPPAPPLSGQTTTRYGGRSPATPCAPLSSGRAASARWGENGVHAGIGHDQVVDVPKNLGPPMPPGAVGISVPVETLVVMQDHREKGPEERDGLKDPGCHLGVQGDLPELLVRQSSRLVEDHPAGPGRPP